MVVAEYEPDAGDGRLQRRRRKDDFPVGGFLPEGYPQRLKPFDSGDIATFVELIAWKRL